MSDGALPMTTDVSESRLRGAPKWAQLGVDAACALLDSVDPGAVAGATGMVFLDLYVRVGDFLDAFRVRRQSMSSSAFFLGVCENQIE
eukprot:8868058-Alexandrium_andersonii.AAC.1